MGKRVDTQYVVVLYTERHLTMQQIGDMLGLTKQAIYKRLRKAGITSDQGEWVECVCDGSNWYITGIILVEAVGPNAVFSS